VLPAEKIDMGGFPVKQALPTQKVGHHDPFLLLHHAKSKYNAKRSAKSQGIGPHPHRGFSPVTFIITGEVHHRDSWNHSQIAKKGEVQWMHAGAGIIHSERPSEEMVQRNEYQEIVQLWINSPANKKMIPPSYQYIAADKIPRFPSKDQKVTNKLIAGTYNDQRGPAQTQSELLIIWGEASTNGTQQFMVPSGMQSMLYLIHGKAKLKNHGLLEKEQLALFSNDGNQVEISFTENSQFILCAGIAIKEPMTQHGSFVMNTQTEILEAMRDYQMGKMGILIEDEL